jgi:hypothetical protein
MKLLSSPIRILATTTALLTPLMVEAQTTMPVPRPAAPLSPDWKITKPKYQFIFSNDQIRDVAQTCSSDPHNVLRRYRAPAGSVFYEVDDDSNSETQKIVFFVPPETPAKAEAPSASADLPREVEPYKPYRLCINDQSTPPYSFVMRSGVHTGLLVVPYKLRGADIHSDATMGPYLGITLGDRWTFVISPGITQVTMVDANKTLQTATGLSLATGLMWSLTRHLELALLVGADHLSSTPSQTFKDQDQPWASFGLGYRFN